MDTSSLPSGAGAWDFTSEVPARDLLGADGVQAVRRETGWAPKIEVTIYGDVVVLTVAASATAQEIGDALKARVPMGATLATRLTANFTLADGTAQ